MRKHELLELIPRPELEKVFSYKECEFDCEFLGFTDTYKALAQIIPKGMVVIDFGCNQALQSYYFKEHEKYIGIDNAIPCEYRYTPENAMHFQNGISQWIVFEFPKLGIDADKCFAICNYVPDWGAQAIVKQTFQNVFNYYPSVKI